MAVYTSWAGKPPLEEGQTYKWTLEDFRRRIEVAAGYQTWDELVEDLLGDTVEASIVADLCAEHTKDGKFREPVVVVDGMLADGCHRFVAAVLLGAPLEFRIGYPQTEQEPQVVDVSFQVLATPDAPEDPDDLAMAAMFASRSLRGKNGNWFAGDLSRSTGEGNITTSLYATTEDATEIEEALRRRLGNLGIDVANITINAAEP